MKKIILIFMATISFIFGPEAFKNKKNISHDAISIVETEKDDEGEKTQADSTTKNSRIYKLEGETLMIIEEVRYASSNSKIPQASQVDNVDNKENEELFAPVFLPLPHSSSLLSPSPEPKHEQEQYINLGNTQLLKSDYVLLCNCVYCEAGCAWLSKEDKACVVEVIMNRTASIIRWMPDTIRGVISQKNQFEGSEDYLELTEFNPKMSEEILAAVQEAVAYYFSDEYENHGYLFFWGDNHDNHFYTDYDSFYAALNG